MKIVGKNNRKILHEKTTVKEDGTWRFPHMREGDLNIGDTLSIVVVDVKDNQEPGLSIGAVLTTERSNTCQVPTFLKSNNCIPPEEMLQ